MKKRVIVTLSIATLAFLLGAVFNFNNTIAGKPVTQVAALAKTCTVFSNETFLPNELKAQDVDVDGFKTIHIQIKSGVYEDFYRTLTFSVSFKNTDPTTGISHQFYFQPKFGVIATEIKTYQVLGPILHIEAKNQNTFTVYKVEVLVYATTL